jgi:shikimate kinase
MWLVGMMATGKSSAGRLAAESLRVPFHDTDDVVAEMTGRSILELWSEGGEAGFREAEKDAVRAMASRHGVRATGGGVVLSEENRRLLGKGEVVWLKASPEVLAARAADHQYRPLLAGDDAGTVLTRLSEERNPLYQAVATDEIDTDHLTLVEVAQQIERIWLS